MSASSPSQEFMNFQMTTNHNIEIKLYIKINSFSLLSHVHTNLSKVVWSNLKETSWQRIQEDQWHVSCRTEDKEGIRTSWINNDKASKICVIRFLAKLTTYWHTNPLSNTRKC